MYWLIGAILLLLGYVNFEVFDWLLAGGISSSIIPYFSWLNPQSTTGGLLLSVIVIIPVYILLSLLVWLVLCHWRNKYAEYPDVLNYLNIHKEGQKMPAWPIMPLGWSMLILVGSFFGVLSRRIDPSHWVMGAILLWGLAANWLFPESAGDYKREKKPGKIESPRADKPDQDKKSVPRIRITANELVEKLKSLRSYRGQCVYRKHEDGKADTTVVGVPKISGWQLPIEAATNIGIKGFYGHQQRFLDLLYNRKNAVLTTPVGSGKATALNAFALCATTHLKSSVLFVCPNEKLGEQTKRELNNMLQQYECKRKLNIVSFISEEGSDKQDKLPNVLITTPDILHRHILPQHKDTYELFFISVGFVLLPNVECYNGIFGTNVAFVLRRLLRVCESKCDLRNKSTPTIGATGHCIANGNEFLNELTGKSFLDDSHISVDKRGYGKREIIFWNPPFERRDKPSQNSGKSSHVLTPDHKRRSYYDEVCDLIIEVFVENFDVALIGTQVLLTSHDIRNTSERIFNKISREANRVYTETCGEIVDWLPEQENSINAAFIMVDKRILDLTISLKKALRDDSKEENTKKKKQAEEKKIQEAKVHLVRLKRIQQQIERLTQICQELFGTHEVKIDDAAAASVYFDELTQKTKELRENTVSLRELTDGLPETDKVREAIYLLAEQAEETIAQIDERVHAVEAKHTKILSRASQIQNGRWIAGSMRDLKSRGVGTERVDASFFLGFPSSPQMLRGETVHTATKRKDSLTCVIVNPQPLSQYYMKTHLKSLDDLGEQETTDDADEIELIFAAGLDNEYVIFNHLLCTIYELEGSMSELKDVFGVLPNSLYNDNRIRWIQKTLVKQSGDGVAVKDKQQWLSYCGDMQFTNRPHLYVFLECVESAYSVKKDDTLLGVVDSGIKAESWFDGAISSMSGERYKVEGTNELEGKGIVGEIRVKDEIARQLTEHRGTAIVKPADYLILLPKGDCFGEGWLGRISPQEVEGLQKDDMLNIKRKGIYRIDQVDHKRRTVQVESTQPSQNLKPITLSQGEIFRIGTDDLHNCCSFRVEAGNVNVQKEIKGYTVFNCIDPEQTSSSDIEISRRSVSTYGLFVVFSESVEMATLHSLAHLMKEFIPSVISCGSHDIEVTFSDKHEDYGSRPVVVLYDNYTGSLGLVKSLFNHRHSLLKAILQRSYDVLVECPCKEGCSCCLHIFQCRGMPKAKGHGESNKDLNKKSAIILLGRMLGITEYKDVIRRRYGEMTPEETKSKKPVMRQEEARVLRDRMLGFLRHNLDIDLGGKQVYLICDTETLKKKAKELGLPESIGGVCDGHSVIVSSDLTEDFMVHLIAHEYTHDWQARNMDSRLRDPSHIRTDVLENAKGTEKLFVEGFAEWVSYRALDFYGLKYRMEPYGKFESSNSPLDNLEYRQGFELMCHIESNVGVAGLLKFIKSGGEGCDFVDLYRKSGVMEYIRAEVEKARLAESGKKKEDSEQTNLGQS